MKRQEEYEKKLNQKTSIEFVPSAVTISKERNLNIHNKTYCREWVTKYEGQVSDETDVTEESVQPNNDTASSSLLQDVTSVSRNIQSDKYFYSKKGALLKNKKLPEKQDQNGIENM